MNISNGIAIVGPALFIKRHHALVLNDLHLGYEEALHAKGVFVPRFQLQEVISTLQKILTTTKPETVVINGDLKHEFGRILAREWKEVLQFLDFLLRNTKNVVIIQGNHDPVIVHGDEVCRTTATRIIIGHEHPAITIREGSKWEKYKCFLKGTWKGKELIVVPSFNPLLEGSDILSEKLLSPFLEDIRNFNVYVVSKGEAFGFGKVRSFAVRKTV